MDLKLPNGINQYFGPVCDTLPELLANGEVPLSVADIMKLRILGGSSDLRNNSFYTSDLSIYPKGNRTSLKILLTTDNTGNITGNGRTTLELISRRNLTGESEEVGQSYNIIARSSRIIKIEGRVKVNVSDIPTGDYQIKKDIANNVGLKILSRHSLYVPEGFEEDNRLIDNYFDFVSRKTGEIANMNCYLGKSNSGKRVLSMCRMGKTSKTDRSSIYFVSDHTREGYLLSKKGKE